MAGNRFPLETLQVASPCHAAWEAMSGDDRVRFCPACRLHVYNLSTMSRSEAEALVREKEGRLCVRYYRRADGTVLTRDCPVGMRAVRRRLALMVSIAAGALLSLVGWGALGSGSTRGSGVGAPSSGLLQTVLDWLRPPQECMGKLAIPPAPAPRPGVAGTNQANPEATPEAGPAERR